MLKPTGRGAVVAHLLWEQGVPSSSLGAPTSMHRIAMKHARRHLLLTAVLLLMPAR